MPTPYKIEAHILQSSLWYNMTGTKYQGVGSAALYRSYCPIYYCQGLCCWGFQHEHPSHCNSSELYLHRHRKRIQTLLFPWHYAIYFRVVPCPPPALFSPVKYAPGQRVSLQFRAVNSFRPYPYTVRPDSLRVKFAPRARRCC
jgi:hypothetical protein